MSKLAAVVLTQYRRVTDGRADGQTDGIAVIQRLQCEHCARCKNARTSIGLCKSGPKQYTAGEKYCGYVAPKFVGPLQSNSLNTPSRGSTSLKKNQFGALVTSFNRRLPLY